METPKFKVSYRGESDYTYNGKEYCVRYFAHDDGHYNGDYYRTGIAPFVGCLRNRRDFFEYPSAAALEAVSEEYPGIVGAKYSEDFTKVSYTDVPRTNIRNGTVYAAWFMNRLGVMTP